MKEQEKQKRLSPDEFRALALNNAKKLMSEGNRVNLPEVSGEKKKS